MIRLAARTLIRVEAGRPPGRTEDVRMGKKKCVVHSAHFRLYCFQSSLDVKPPPTTGVKRTKRLSAGCASGPIPTQWDEPSANQTRARQVAHHRSAIGDGPMRYCTRAIPGRSEANVSRHPAFRVAVSLQVLACAGHAHRSPRATRTRRYSRASHPHGARNSAESEYITGASVVSRKSVSIFRDRTNRLSVALRATGFLR